MASPKTSGLRTGGGVMKRGVSIGGCEEDDEVLGFVVASARLLAVRSLLPVRKLRSRFASSDTDCSLPIVRQCGKVNE